MRLKSTVSLALAGGLLFAAASANATTVLATFTGTIIESQNPNGLFGIEGTLDGLSYTASFYHQLERASGTDDGQYNRVQGYYPNNPVFVVLSINNNEMLFGGDYGVVIRADGYDAAPPKDYVFYGATGGANNTSFYNEIYSARDFLTDTAFDAPADVWGQGGDILEGYFISGSFEAGTYVSASMRPAHFTTSVLAQDVEFPPHGPGIPEPDTWALMILGFGSVCVRLRRALPRLPTR